MTVFNRGRAALADEDGAGRVAPLVGDRTDLAAFEARVAGPFDCAIEMRCFTPAEAASTVRAFRGRARQVLFCSTVDVYQKPAARYPVTEDEPRDTLRVWGPPGTMRVPMAGPASKRRLPTPPALTW